MTRIGSLLLAAVASAGLGLSTTAQAQQADMSFFVTSVGKGNGADLGGIAGADAHCQALAKAAGAASPNWRAYLSTTEPGGNAGVNARDRIGNGPWKNAKGVVVAKNLDDLHSASANINKQTALTEKGEALSGSGDPVNMHDILTGSDPHGHVLDRRRRHHLRQLDQERRRLGHRRPSRPCRSRKNDPAHDVLELLARLARLQPGPAEGLRRRRLDLLLPHQLGSEAA